MALKADDLSLVRVCQKIQKQWLFLLKNYKQTQIYLR